jgi:hypothetical protein
VQAEEVTGSVAPHGAAGSPDGGRSPVAVRGASGETGPSSCPFGPTHVTVIDRPPPRPQSYVFGARQQKPTAATGSSGLTERRGRRSGQIESKPCPGCSGAVALDPRRMRTDDERVVITCPSCGALVGVRRSDLYRAPSEAPTDEHNGHHRRGWWGRKGD